VTALQDLEWHISKIYKEKGRREPIVQLSCNVM
jgi:hypothetical protein